MGRSPAKYSTILGTEICERIAGGENLLGICKDHHMPASSTVFKWMRDHGTDRIGAEFRDMYDRATVERTEALGEQTLDIADNCAETKEGVLKARLKTEVRFKHMAMLRPRKFGKAIDVTSGGEKLGNVGAVVFEVAKQVEDDERSAESAEAIETEGVEAVPETSTE